MNQPLDACLTSDQDSRPTLSICISTLNRAPFLAKTLDTIVPQLTDECEIVVLDNASTDDTSRVVASYGCNRIRYVRKDTEDDLDRNFDRVVELARGEYCWLFPDDDFFKPGSIAAVLSHLKRQPSLVLVNFEFRDFSMKQVLQRGCLDYSTDREYGPWELDRLFVEMGDFVRYIGAIVIRRSIWLVRNRTLYIGSYFNFVGMLFQDRFPGSVHVIAQPYVSYRSDNSHSFSPKTMEIALAKWPSLIASLPVSTAAKRTLASAYPWKHIHQLLIWRGAGLYCHRDYSLWIRPRLARARDKIIPRMATYTPRAIANLMMLLYFYMRRRRRFRQLDSMYYQYLKRSSFHFHNWWTLRQKPVIPAQHHS